LAESESDLVDEYREYLSRFEARFGSGDFGEYAKHQGRLVKKLRFEEFETKWAEYREVIKAYGAIMERGDTINDMIVRVLRERSDDLLLERPV
jgi:hypothetical protein